MSERPFSSTKRRKVFVTNEAEALRALNHGSEEALAWFIDRYSAYVHTIISNLIGRSMSYADIELSVMIMRTTGSLSTVWLTWTASPRSPFPANGPMKTEL